MIIGIDNGLSGGLVALSFTGSIIASFPMPTQKTRKGNEIDVRAIKEWLYGPSVGFHQSQNAVFVIEEPGGAQSAKAASSMAASFGALRGALSWAGCKIERVTPQAWQKAMLGKVPAGETKAVALTKAREIWPDESWLATERSRVPHDGLVDAALIAEYYRRVFYKEESK